MGLLALPVGHLAGLFVAALMLLSVVITFARADVPMLRLAPWLLLGFLYGHWQNGAVLDARLPLCADESLRAFELTIMETPVLTQPNDAQDRWVARFRAEVVTSDGDDCLSAGSHSVRLTWHDPPLLRKGERWQVEGRLRPPWGNANPGGFDYERWLLGEGLAGTGYVKNGRRVQGAHSTLDLRTRIREGLRSWLEARPSAHTGIMLALMTGDDSGLGQREWRLLRNSGTVHLLVVSGLHVGMVSGGLFLLGLFLGRIWCPLLLWIGARRLAGMFALTGSGAYVWLSGSGVPALRAWLMSALVLLVLSSGRTVRGLHVVLLVMALVLIANPLVVHQQGFWLSFAAVLALIAWFEPALVGIAADKRSLRCRVGLPLMAFLQVQVVLMLALSPLLAEFQGGVPLQSPLVNALVVPLVTFGVLPLLLVAALLYAPLPALAGVLLTLAEVSLDGVMFAISAAAQVPTAAMSIAGVDAWLLMLLVLLVLRQRPNRRWTLLSIGLWWALLLPDGRMPSAHEFRVTALDVGQGSAVLVDTNRHRLIFDAGPRYASGFDLGDAAVIPSFQRLGRGDLDSLVISHDDIDHAGGAQSVIRHLAPGTIWTSFQSDGELNRRRSCTVDNNWEWDGVEFRFLHPESGWQGSDNDTSCVLLISNGRRSALLSGDISHRVERRLPKQPVDLLMAPHHGSRTSSSMSFVRGFSPHIVFVSTDRRSRYGHPHPEVIARYASAQVWITGRSGALAWQSDNPHAVVAQRQRRSAYWRRRLEPVRP